MSMTASIRSRWWREASSGTTPPYSRWISACEAITFDRMARPRRTAAAVSSQEVSIPRISGLSTLIVPSLLVMVRPGRRPSGRTRDAPGRPRGLAAQAGKAHLEGRPRHAALRDDRGDQTVRRDVERRMDHPHSLGHDAPPADVGDLGGTALLDRNVAPGGRLEIDRRGRGGDVERHLVRPRQDGDLIG